MNKLEFLEQHRSLTRRYFLEAGTVGMTALYAKPGRLEASFLDDESGPSKSTTRKAGKAGAQPTPYFTAANEFRDVSRGI